MNEKEVKKLIEQRKSTRQIAKELNVSRGKLMDFMRERGLKTLHDKPSIKSTKLDIRIGQRFGKLTVTGLKEMTKDGQVCVCECDCGTKGVKTYSTKLKSGRKASCGCLIGKASKPIRPKKWHNLVGVKRNRLLATEIVRKEYGIYRLKCLCDCGNITFVRGDFFDKGRSKSCGCLQKEKAGEVAIENGRQGHRYKWYFIKNGEPVRCDSGFEVIYANYLIDSKIDFLYHPERFRLSNGKSYNPDFLIDGKYIEIKGNERNDYQKINREIFKKDHDLTLLYWCDLIEIVPNIYRSYATCLKKCLEYGSKEKGMANRAYLSPPESGESYSPYRELTKASREWTDSGTVS